MTKPLPKLYFRVKANGATVFRIDTQNREKRLLLKSIAQINFRNLECKLSQDQEFTQDEKAEVTTWLADRSGTIEKQESENVHQLTDQMGIAAHWIQTKASDTQIEQLSNSLLLSIHDLRTTLNKRMAKMGKS